MSEAIYYNIRRPWQPLPSDRTVLWLASSYAAAGYRVLPATEPYTAGEDCALLLTNRAANKQDCPYPVLAVGNDGDRRDRIRLSLGYLYGRTPFYQRRNRAGLLVSGMLRPLRALLGLRRGGTHKVVEDNSEADIAGRRVVLRVNVDWDERGLDILERWYGHFDIRATLAAAGSEVDPNRVRFRQFVKDTGCDLASHTWSHHVVLSSFGRARQRMEIGKNQDFLQQLTGIRVNGFVAPYIKYHRHTFELLEEAGYTWFIRNWLLHPLTLQGTGLTDLGVNFSFARGWQNRIQDRLIHSDLVLQLHLPDLVKHEHLLEHNIRSLLQRGVRIVDCATFLREKQEERR